MCEPDPKPYEGQSRVQEALARVAAQGDHGLTSIELDHETGWPMGTATGSLSKLAAAGLVHQPGPRRAHRGAYVITVAGEIALDAWTD